MGGSPDGSRCAALTASRSAQVRGIRLATAAAGIRYRDRTDLLLMELAPGSSTAALFTRNAFCAAPVTVAREHLERAAPRYLLINAGNANAGTGDRGVAVCRETCRQVADLAGCTPHEVLPFSTGVIGEDLPTDPFAAALPGLLAELDAARWEDAAAAIMTTDTVPKLATTRIDTGAGSVTITGIAKGSGMICPDMATMLAFIATDAVVSPPLLWRLLREAAADTFNAITVDGDTSTNDACVLSASGISGVNIGSPDLTPVFAAGLHDVCDRLAAAIVRDGEGATKLVSINVEAAADAAEARRVAYTVAHSPLVKTALTASDPNWGRILAAVGRSGVIDLVVDRVRIWLDDVCIVRDGGRASDYTEADGQRVMSRTEFSIHIHLARGDAAAVVRTCDLSKEYVRINAEYRT